MTKFYSMHRPDPTQVQQVTVVGTGVIGSGWVAHFLRNGMDVVAFDPAPEAEARLRQKIADLWPTMVQLGLAEGASPDRFTFAPDMETAVSNTQFIQENVPEREALKIKVIEEIDAVAAPNVVIASSTSGILMSKMQQGCRYPERCIVAHPFVPPYLVPLVEVVPGKQTDPAVTAWTVDFYKAIGKKPLRLDKEFPGFLADRLLEAVWREALHLIADGLVTVEEVDAAMADGPGLRWAIFGPMLTYHLGGGEGGMAHFLDQFGPALDLPWSYMDPPTLTPVLRERLITGCENEANGRSIQELEHERDQCLIGILDALEKYRRPKKRLAQLGPSQEMNQYAYWTASSEIELPLKLYRCTVESEWIDYNGHMTDGAYLIAFGYASDALFRYVGITEAYRTAGYSFYTVETHVNFYHEVAEGEPLRFTTQLLGLDKKRLHLFHSMFHGKTDTLLATTEQMLLHVDMNASAARGMETAVFDALNAIMAAHKVMPLPKQVGRQIAVK